MMDSKAKKAGALSNITIIDLSRVLCGPFCTMILADMGANVIKIEAPGAGDDTRFWGPYINGYSLYYSQLNRNKRGVTLNLKSATGLSMLKDMVKQADVLIENFRPGVMDKLGLGYNELHAINERLVYASISGFGQYGPYSQRPGYDLLAQAMGGLMSLTGPEGGEPTRVGCAIADVMSGMTTAIGILSAINARSITGKGQHVDVALTDTVAFAASAEFLRYQASGVVPQRTGNRYAAFAPFCVLNAKDEKFILACANQKLYEQLVSRVLKNPEFLEDERFKTVSLRAENSVALREKIEKEWSTKISADDAIKQLIAAGIPGGPIYDSKQLMEDEHISEVREMFVPIKHPVIGECKIIGNPIKLSDTKPEIRTNAPMLGEHNNEVYGEMLGLSADQIEKLKEDGVL